MRVGVFFAVCALLRAQSDPLDKAYEALRQKQFDDAVAFFLKAMEAAPGRASIHKDLGYTYLKIGDTEAARDQFREAARLDPADLHGALEYGFLCYETRQHVAARRIFDRIRKSADPKLRDTAEQAFQNIDLPLKTGIEKWLKAIELGADNFSAHFELATFAERRDELHLAARHYERAWRLSPERRSVLLDLGRVWKALERPEQADAALLAASRGGTPRTAETARELLPPRYPYVYEFRRALELDPGNTPLRRELGYLLLRMHRPAEALAEFRIITESEEKDLLSAAQLGFLYLAAAEREKAMPLLDRVLRGADDELANRVRAVLRMPQVLRDRSAAQPRRASVEAKLMAERSIKAGYLKDALKYLQLAHEADPVDFGVMLKLGWAHNILHNDAQAVRWFDMARKSSDPQVSSQAARFYENLRPDFARIRTTLWVAPIYSSRWRDVFSYSQLKTEVRLSVPLRPYASLRFIGDARGIAEAGRPVDLSESSFILGGGLATKPWNGFVLWGEAGAAMTYARGRIVPDYRGGMSVLRGFGPGTSGPGWFCEAAIDGVFVGRFGNDFLAYSRNRLGFRPDFGSFHAQLYWNGDLTIDSARQYWANFAETGPGVRFRWASMPKPLLFSLDFLRGAHTRNGGNPRRPNFFDLRVGLWYAVSR